MIPSSLGCSLIPDFVSDAEEALLILAIENDFRTCQEIESRPGKRSRCLRYGFDYYAKPVPAPIPTWIEALRPRCPNTRWDSVTLNEYQPGCRIDPHIDSRAFGEPILILGLGANCQFVLSHENLQPRGFTFPRRALLSLAGLSRYPWLHAIEPVEALRYSIVLRIKK